MFELGDSSAKPANTCDNDILHPGDSILSVFLYPGLEPSKAEQSFVVDDRHTQNIVEGVNKLPETDVLIE